MVIEQFYDRPLAHASYAVISNNEIFLVDPGRNPRPYLDFAKKHGGKIVAVFETHPHADFASSHKEFLDRYDARVYINPRAGVDYEFEPMEHEDQVQIGGLTIKALYTPGHSPDHNSYLLMDPQQREIAVFSGDSLFIGDVGRPDLREGAGNIQLDRQQLAEMMFHTIHQVYSNLDDGTIVYPAHGAGSLCGRSMSTNLSGTLREQKETNWAFQIRDKDRFVSTFLEGQPFIPKYFPHSVEINRQGLAPLTETIDTVPRIDFGDGLADGITIIDTRDKKTFKAGHLPGAVNIQCGEDQKFETWLGTIVEPGKPFYLVSESESDLLNAIERTAKIGYEPYIKGALISPDTGLVSSNILPLNDFREHPDQYTIIDTRNASEKEANQYFDSAINIPLPELQDRLDEIPNDKPIVFHCAGGYRSAIGSSLVENGIENELPVYDLSEHISEFLN